MVARGWMMVSSRLMGTEQSSSWEDENILAVDGSDDSVKVLNGSLKNVKMGKFMSVIFYHTFL